jgi:hypothetical protein
MADLNQIYSPGVSPLLQNTIQNLMRQPADANSAQGYQSLLSTLSALQAKKNGTSPLDGLGGAVKNLGSLASIFGGSGGAGAGAGAGAAGLGADDAAMMMMV